MAYTPIKPNERGRTFYVAFGPSMADPDYSYPLCEYRPGKYPEGVMPPRFSHHNWKARLIKNLIKWLLPIPDIYGK